MLLQAVIGLEIDGVRKTVTFADPVLPPWLPWLRIAGIILLIVVISRFFRGFVGQTAVLISIIIGMVGGLLGGQMVAPLISSSPIVSGDFNIHALFIAAVTAAACLAIANMIENRFGV